MASCGLNCLKFMLYAFNLVFWAAGIAVMGVGIYARTQDFSSLTGDSGFQTVANIMIAAGALVIIIGFIGCCGAKKENKCLLIMYALMLLLIFILEIAAGILAYTRRDEVINSIEESVKKAIVEDYKADKEKLEKAVDKAQETLKCCGVDGPSDWNNATFGKVPKSCCKEKGCDPTKSDEIFSEGCSQALQDFVKSKMKTLGGIGVGIAIIQILGIVFAMCMFRSIGYEKI